MNSFINVCGREIKVQGRLFRIARIEGDSFKFLDDPEAMIEGLKKCGKRIDLFTFLPRLSETAITYPYQIGQDNLAVIKISTFDDWWNKQIRTSSRNRARLAGKKQCVIREVPFDGALAKGIWEIYNECPVRQGKRFLHYGKDPETVYKEASTFLDSSIFIGAFLEDRLIGFIKLVVDRTHTQASIMHIISMIQHRDKAPTNALIAEAVRLCADRGISYLVYGNFAYGKKERSSLSDFKECNGFKRFDLQRYYVPLTGLGSFAVQFGLYRSVATCLPISFSNQIRKLREAWYCRMFQSAMPVSKPSLASNGNSRNLSETPEDAYTIQISR